MSGEQLATSKIRALLVSHEPIDQWQLLGMVLDILDGQEREIAQLSSELHRQEQRAIALNREIDRLKGTHGA